MEFSSHELKSICVHFKHCNWYLYSWRRHQLDGWKRKQSKSIFTVQLLFMSITDHAVFPFMHAMADWAHLTFVCSSAKFTFETPWPYSNKSSTKWYNKIYNNKCISKRLTFICEFAINKIRASERKKERKKTHEKYSLNEFHGNGETNKIYIETSVWWERKKWDGEKGSPTRWRVCAVCALRVLILKNIFAAGLCGWMLSCLIRAINVTLKSKSIACTSITHTCDNYAMHLSDRNCLMCTICMRISSIDRC